MAYLCRAKVLLKDFAQFVSGCTDRVRQATHQLAAQSGRPVTYLQRSSERKEALARRLAQREGIGSGMIGIWSCVEPCYTYFVRRDREQKKLVLRLEPGKCLHYSGFRFYAFALADVVPLSSQHLYQWPSLVGAADGGSRSCLSTTRELFYVD